MNSLTNITSDNLEINWEVQDKLTKEVFQLSYLHSHHSMVRANERKIDQRLIKVVIDYGKAFFKQGMIFYVFGKKQSSHYGKSNSLLKNLVVVVAGDSNKIITCYRSKNPFKHVKKKQKHLARWSSAA